MTDELRVCHIADIHYRGGISRHKEYERVFTRFAKKARELKPDVIYVGGDIFHTKTQNITPEVIDCLSWWFKLLADIAPVIVTLGNHDGNLMNRDRQDAISPIIELLDDSRITLCKKSGVYKSPVDGFNFCVFSCFDELGWEQVKPVEDDINIACFHGAVNGSKTEQDYELKGEVRLEFFKGYDFAMLGDIHKMQFLAHRDCIDGTRRPWIAYCGSTVQQNYAEDIEHGFLFWKIRKRDDFDVQFIPIHNENMFVTLDWTGDVSELTAQVDEYAQGARFRVRSKGPIAQGDWRGLSHALKSRYGAAEVVPKVEPQVELDVSRSKLISEMTHNLRDAKHMRSLFREYYSGQLDENELLKLDELVTKYVKASSATSTVTRNVRWSLDKLKFSNTFAYGDDNEIDFNRMSGITGIFAPNASGKSSIIGTMMYGLYNATDRGPMKNLHVINMRKHDCSCEAQISIDGVKHTITRSSRKQTNKKGMTSAITSLDFRCDTTGANLNGEQRNDTEKAIRSKIGTADDFILTSLAVQGGLKAFISEGPSQRKAILSRFLDLQLFETMHEIAKNDSNVLKSRIKDMPERDWDDMHEKLKTRHRELESEVSRLDVELKTQRGILAERNFALSSITELDDVVSQQEVDRQRDKISKMRDQLTEKQAQLTRITKRLEAAQHGMTLIDNVKKNFSLAFHEEKEKRFNELEEWVLALEMKLKTTGDDVERTRRSVLKLADVPCDDEYPQCKYIRDSHNDKERLHELEIVFDELRDDLSGKQMKLDSLRRDPAFTKLKRYRNIISRRNDVELRATRLEGNQYIIQREIDDMNVSLEAALAELEKLKSKLGQTSVARERARLKDDIQDIESAISSMEGERTSALQKMGRIDEAVDTLKRERREYEKLLNDWRMYEKVIQATSKKGIPTQLLRHLMPSINEEIAGILNGIVDFTIELELPDDTNSMDVYINDDKGRRIIELGSGMEKMIASIAIRVALINISSLPKTDMFMIDEGFSELDDKNIDSCGTLLRSLTRWFKNIIIITHIGSLKDVVDNVIDIARIGDDAKVVVA